MASLTWYNEEIHFPEYKYDHLSYILSLRDISELSDSELISIGAPVEFETPIFDVLFEDGSVIRFSLERDKYKYIGRAKLIPSDCDHSILFDKSCGLSNIGIATDRNMYFVRVICDEV